MIRGPLPAAAGVAAIILAGCAGESSPSPPSSAAPVPPVSTPSTSDSTPQASEDAFAQARPVAMEYLRGVALGESDAARALEAAPDNRSRGRLAALARWLGGIPIVRIRGDGTPVTLPPGYPAGSLGVSVSMRARLVTGGEWVLLGRRVLVMTQTASGWRVASDATHDERLGIVAQGLSVFAHPRFLKGQRTTVVYGTDSARGAARDIIRAADAALPRLSSSYGGGATAERPLILLVKDRAQGERLAGLQGKDETPLGTVGGGFTYVFLRQFGPLDHIGRASSVVALMTILATRDVLKSSPTSLTNGLASYEEDRYLAARGFVLPLDDIGKAYPRYPSLERWTSTASLWGLAGKAGVLANQDALAMVHVIVTRYGGAGGVRRLGEAFRTHGPGDFTPAQVRGAFRRALGVTFEAVRAQARAYVQSGDWKYH